MQAWGLQREPVGLAAVPEVEAAERAGLASLVRGRVGPAAGLEVPPGASAVGAGVSFDPTAGGDSSR